jgi:nucleotide-binding universal stress UspA family protein
LSRHPLPLHQFGDIPPNPKSYERRFEEVVTYLTNQQKDFRKKGIDVQQYVGNGPIVKAIINAAEHFNVDIIAMTSHGRTGLPRVFYGSVMVGVLHQIDRPLLLIRSLDNGNS